MVLNMIAHGRGLCLSWGFLTILFGLCIPSKGDAASSSDYHIWKFMGRIWSSEVSKDGVWCPVSLYIRQSFSPLLATSHRWSSILKSIYTSCYLQNFPLGSMDDSWPSLSLIWWQQNDDAVVKCSAWPYHVEGANLMWYAERASGSST